MLELPEAITISRQLNKNVCGKRIISVTAAHSPHKFAFYYGDPIKYNDLLVNKVIGRAEAFGGMVEIRAEDAVILLGDGAGMRFHQKDEKRPEKHQLLIELENSTALSVSVQMYGGIWCFIDGELENDYYEQAKLKPSPLSQEFDRVYFEGIISAQGNERISAKALLATEQRIPGLGNGVLQDILYNAKIHPKRKVNTLTEDERDKLYDSIKTTLAQMAADGGRDTERDLLGSFGGYKTRLSKNTADKACQLCGSKIMKEAYMGGSIYFCPGCQKL